MRPCAPLALAALTLTLFLPARGEAQVARRPVRYLFVDPPPQVVVTPPPPVVPLPPPGRVLVRVHTPPPLPAPPASPPAVDADDPQWFVGAGAGALFRFDGAGREATPSYRLDLGVALGGAEFGLRFDLAPGFQTGDDRAALYTAGAAFGYRFLPRTRLHPVVGIGLESVFFNPQGASTARAFALTGRVGLEMDVPTAFGTIAVGLDVRAHQPLAGAEEAQATLLGAGAHFALRFD